MIIKRSRGWALGKRFFLDPSRRLLAQAAHPGGLALHWCRGKNWGDALSPVLVEALSGKKVFHAEGLHHDRFLAIGSILGGANGRAAVWGSGFIREGEKVVSCPRAVHAVRGPLTRDALLRQGVDCPPIFGDPALLLPRFFNPKIKGAYSVGIIPHYVDKDVPFIKKHQNDPAVLVIDIEQDIFSFVEAVKSCHVILSSSLHGLICADAYGIPNAWIRLSDKVMGGDFKFRDHRLAMGADPPEAHDVTDESRIAVLSRRAELIPMGVDIGSLLLSCPFLMESLRREASQSLSSSQELPESFTSATMRRGEQVRTEPGQRLHETRRH